MKFIVKLFPEIMIKSETVRNYYSQIIMKFIVKLFPEIMIKSETVRKRFAKILTSNIRNILQKYDEETAVVDLKYPQYFTEI